MSFGNIIKKLRQDKNMTQEQLADVLSISAQAVSRWETNLALPDILLLPILANYFDVTTDYLLEVDITRKEKEIAALLEKARSYTTKGQWKAGIEILRKAVKKYPAAYQLMNELAYALFCSPQETEQELLEEVISLEETVLDNAKDIELQYSASSLLCIVYGKSDRLDKAEVLANRMPSIYECKEELLVSFCKGTKRYRRQQDATFAHLELLLRGIKYNAAPLEDGLKPYTIEEMIALNKKVIDVLNIMFENQEYGFFGQTVAWTYLDIAWFYAKLENREKTLEYLKLAKEQAIANDRSYDVKKEYTSLVFRGKKFGTVWHNIRSNDSMHQIEEMQDEVYTFLKEETEFQRIIVELKEYAGEIGVKNRH